MRDITIKNFRCYEEKSMTFRPGINLLIGDNSVGKTSLLIACNYVMSAFFSGYSKTYTKWESARKKDFHIAIGQKGTSVQANKIDITFHASPTDFFVIKMPDGATMELDFKKDLKIEKKSTKNAKPLVRGLRILKSYGNLLAKYAHIITKEGGVVQMNALPVYSYFSTEDIHASGSKFDKSGFRVESQIASFGYFRCSDSKGLFECWINRLLVLQEADEDRTEIENVRNAIIDALGPNGCNIIKDISFKINRKKMVFKQVDGRVVEHDFLSDGYRRLVNIVLDISIRCALLNKEMYGSTAYKQTHGTVIIDEIDEHLHPELQLRILKALHETFPKIQFIVSTHSPLVISSVETSPENVVYKLEYDKEQKKYSHSELKTYGLDASTIISAYMGQTVRDTKIAAEFKAIRKLIDEEKFAEATAKLDNLKRETETDDPEFTELETMISFLED